MTVAAPPRAVPIRRLRLASDGCRDRHSDPVDDLAPARRQLAGLGLDPAP